MFPFVITAPHDVWQLHTIGFDAERDTLRRRGSFE